MRIDEVVTPGQLNSVEQSADALWNKIGVDIEFTNHFLDRVNDKRNGDPITADELVALFKKQFDRHGETIKTMKQPDALMIDLLSKINVPVVVKQKDKNHKELVATTVMRTPQFRSPPSQRKFPVK